MKRKKSTRRVGRPRIAPPAGSTAAKITAARRRAKLTVEQLALACATSADTIYRFERGGAAPSISQAKQLAAACGVKDFRRLLGDV